MDELKIKRESPEKENEPLFDWHANLIMLNRRKTVVLVNDKNRYVVVLYGLKAKDIQKLDLLILQGIREVFQLEGIKEELIEEFLSHSNQVIFSKTKDRTSVARMNKSVDPVFLLEDYLVTDLIVQSDMSAKISRFLVGDGKDSFFQPNEGMYKDLEAFFKTNIFSLKAAEMKITINLENHQVWRKLVVPLNMTFSEFHKALQVVFGWKDRHLHEFYIFDDETSGLDLSKNHPAFNKEGKKPIVNLVCAEDAFDFENDVPMKLETVIRLSEYMPATMNYVYDFGDNWRLNIRVEKVLDDYDKPYPLSYLYRWGGSFTS